MKASDFKPGDLVVITGGTFERFKGVVNGSDGVQLIVRIDIFGRPVEVPVSAIDLKKITAHDARD
jgi:transcription antitermination factor NusG